MSLGARTKFRQLLHIVGAFRPFMHDVPLAQLRHDTKHVHLQEGYGGAPIENFPPRRFFSLEIAGHNEEARRAFVDWYRLQFDRYHEVSKGKGGLHGGSLYREVLEHHVRAGVALDRAKPVFRDDLVQRAVEARVEQRLGLVRSIRDSGYHPSASDPVLGIAQPDQTIRLEGGAHRAAALHALGLTTLPSVLVLPPRTRQALRTLKVIR